LQKKGEKSRSKFGAAFLLGVSPVFACFAGPLGILAGPVAQVQTVYIFAPTNIGTPPQPAGQFFQFYTEAARD
jgi:hypothetical protein